MCPVEFVPGEVRAGGRRRLLDLLPALRRHMRVLPAPDQEEFAPDLADPGEGVVLHSLAEPALVDVGGVKAHAGQDLRIHGGAKGEVPADADAQRAEPAGAVGMGPQEGEDGARIGVVAGELLGGLEDIAAIGAGLVIGEDRAGRLQSSW